MGKELNRAQEQAVRAPERPLLIVAGAGTGKTRTLTSRIAYFIEERGVPPGNICAITFTNKAAKEMAERMAAPRLRNRGARASGPGGAPFIGTFHAFGARILREEARRAGRTPNFTIFDNHDSFDLVKKTLKQLDLGDATGTPGMFVERISEIKSGSRDLDSLDPKGNTKDALLLEILNRYEDALRENNAFDFDDLIEKPAALLRADPAILEKHRKRFPYLLIDEYQDLNNRQYELVRLLAGGAARLSVVGDDQQMIYGWRGSNFRIFLDFERDWPGAHVVTLEQNYRSTPTIIQAASALIAHNELQRPKDLWTENPDGPRITLAEAHDEDDEARWIASKLAEEDDRRSAAVLYRTNAQSRALEQALIENEIPYLIFGGLKFYERREIKDVVAALRYAANPKDAASRDRLEKNLSKRVFRTLALELPARGETHPAELIRFFLTATDYFSFLDRNFANPVERRENIEELIRFASAFAKLSPFLEQVSLLQATDSLKDGDRHAVHLMTIHLAKGLEFDRVFIAGCAEGLLPHARSLETQEKLEEERRLMYVAMTRARKELAVSFYDLPSRFVGEIPQELVEFRNTSGEEAALTDEEERYITLD